MRYCNGKALPCRTFRLVIKLNFYDNKPCLVCAECGRQFGEEGFHEKVRLTVLTSNIFESRTAKRCAGMISIVCTLQSVRAVRRPLPTSSLLPWILIGIQNVLSVRYVREFEHGYEIEGSVCFA